MTAARFASGCDSYPDEARRNAEAYGNWLATNVNPGHVAIQRAASVLPRSYRDLSCIKTLLHLVLTRLRKGNSLPIPELAPMVQKLF